MGTFQSLEPDWLSVDEARERVLRGATPLPVEIVSPEAAVGRWLRRDVIARVTLPPWPNAAMDGYAVRAVDLTAASRTRPAELQVVGRIGAGDSERPPVTPGTAVRIMTGAPLPSGADSVVRVEDTDAEAQPGRVLIHDSRDAGANVREAGRDLRVGTPVLRAGTRVTPGAVASLVAAGCHDVPVGRRPRVAILASGDELAAADGWARVEAGAAIPESNGPMLAALCRAAGAEPALLPLVGDDADALRRIVCDARAGVGACRSGRLDGPPDVLLTIGGASMGDADLLKDLLLDLGMTLDFWRVRMRPGSPFASGHLPAPEAAESDRRPDSGDPQGCGVLMLPGNPASTFVTFHVFVRPLLERLAGAAGGTPGLLRGRTRDALSSTPSLCQFHRVRVCPTGADLEVELTGATGSGLVSGLAHADALAIVPEGVAEVPAGALVDCLWLHPGPTAGVGDA